MPWNHWDALAKAVAHYAQTNSISVRRGTVCIRIACDHATVQGYFGNRESGVDRHPPLMPTLIHVSLLSE